MIADFNLWEAVITPHPAEPEKLEINFNLSSLSISSSEKKRSYLGMM